MLEGIVVALIGAAMGVFLGHAAMEALQGGSRMAVRAARRLIC
jgi:hypothetical protein